MARYKIYDNSSDVITPVGEVHPAVLENFGIFNGDEKMSTTTGT